MSNTPSYSVKQSGEMGMLKLKLTRDPRASTVKSPLRQVSLTETSKTSNKGTDETHLTTSPTTPNSTDVTTNSDAQMNMADTTKSKLFSHAPASSGSHDQVKTTKSATHTDSILLQSVLKHVVEPKKDVVFKKTHPQPSVKMGPSTTSQHSSSKTDNALLKSITQSYATLETFLSLHKGKPVIPPSSQAASKLNPAPAKSQIMLASHSSQNAAKPLNPLATVILSNPVKPGSFKPITLITPSTVKSSTTVSPPVTKPLKTILPSSKPVVSIAAKHSVSSTSGKQSKPMASTSVKPTASTSVKSNPISPSSNSLPKAKKARVQSTSLPASRVRTIMKTNVKSSQNSLNISQESVQMVGRATELFISELVKGAHKATLESAQNEVTYNHLARAVHKNPDEMRFLYDILPEKVKVKDYLASLHLQDRDGSSD